MLYKKRFLMTCLEIFLLVMKYTAKLKNVTSPWKEKLPSHMKGISHNSYESGTTAFGNLTSIFFFIGVDEKPFPLGKSELSKKSSHWLTCFSVRQGAKWYTNKPVTTRLIRKNAPKKKTPHREIVQPFLRPNVVVCASIIASTSRDWVISCVNLKRKKYIHFLIFFLQFMLIIAVNVH